MKFLSKLFIALILSSTTLMAMDAPAIRGGHIVKAYKETQRKIRWVKADSSHIYLAPKTGKKFVNIFVKLQKGFTISTADYALMAKGDEFEALSLVGYKDEYGEKGKFGQVATKPHRYFKILFEVPDDINKFDVVFKLKTTVPQKTIEQLSFTFSPKETFKIPGESKK